LYYLTVVAAKTQHAQAAKVQLNLLNPPAAAGTRGEKPITKGRKKWEGLFSETGRELGRSLGPRRSISEIEFFLSPALQKIGKRRVLAMNERQTTQPLPDEGKHHVREEEGRLVSST